MRPSDSVCLLILLAPLALVFARQRYAILSWWTVVFLSAVTSWLAVNYCTWIDTPSNGLNYSVGFLLGWIWALPLVFGLWLASALLHRFAPGLSRSKAFKAFRKYGLLGVLAVTAALLVHGVFGWVSRGTAIDIAAKHFSRSHIITSAPLEANWSWWTWRVHPTGEEMPYVDISRSGSLIGGQGQ